MRILFLSQVFPYPFDSGPKVRIYYALRHLAREHRITLLTFIRTARELDHVPHLLEFCEDVRTVTMKRSRLRDVYHLLSSFLKNQSFIILRDHVPEMRVAVERLLDRDAYDVVHADQLAMAQYAEDLGRVGKVLDEHNAVWTIVERLAEAERNPLRRVLLRHESQRLKRYEAIVCRKFDQVLAVTQEDRQRLQALSAHPCNIEVIPICMDGSAIDVVHRAPDAQRILHVGTMFWPPNVDGVLWFAEKVLPLIRREIPAASFWVVGARPPRSVRRLAETGPATVVTGYVEDLAPHWTHCAVFVVPLRAGGGMRVKIVEALFKGVPIVSTSIGCEGIDVKDGEHLLIADEPEEFAGAVVEVLRNHELATRLSINGRRLAEDEYDWRNVYQRFTEVYKRLESTRVGAVGTVPGSGLAAGGKRTRVDVAPGRES